MRAPAPVRPSPASPRLGIRERRDRVELWTEAVAAPPAVYGERWATFAGRTYRSFEPSRSKLAAALARGWAGPVPVAGERWLYLGAASGTTASHVADLVGPNGAVYAVEKSVRPFARLVAVADRWPSLLPILGDARDPEAYADRVPLVDGVYADIAQADQVDLLLRNASLFLRDAAGAIVLALKTSSMGRTLPASGHVRGAEEAVGAEVRLATTVRLDPFYRSHYLIGGRRGGERAPSGKEPSGLGRRPGTRRFRPLRERRS
jgi:fibrillarin-like pre-rRNA processing protein